MVLLPRHRRPVGARAAERPPARDRGRGSDPGLDRRRLRRRAGTEEAHTLVAAADPALYAAKTAAATASATRAPDARALHLVMAR